MLTDIQKHAPTHVLLTRYNLSIPASHVNLDSDWLRHRFRIFADLCLPSVVSQDTQNFRWFILVDSRTSNLWLRQIERVLPANAQLLPINGYLDDNPLIEPLERAGVSPITPLLTSRLDNDDAIGTSYISAMYRAALKADPGAQSAAFNMPIGVQMNLGRLYVLIDLSNPFMSLLERGHARMTVLGVSHRRLKDYARVQQVLIRPQWTQIVHMRNLDNRIRGVRLPRRSMERLWPNLVALTPTNLNRKAE